MTISGRHAPGVTLTPRAKRARTDSVVIHLRTIALSKAHFGHVVGKQPPPQVVTVAEPPGSAAILAASEAGETPALPGKSRQRCSVTCASLQNEHCTIALWLYRAALGCTTRARENSDGRDKSSGKPEPR